MKGDRSDMKDQNIVVGIITSRKCPTCGHHEVGYETEDGTFFPLRPGDRIGIFSQPGVPDAGQQKAEHSESVIEQKEEDPAKWAPWVPEPLRCSRTLCRKYGVLIDKTFIEGDISPALYEMAYRQRLQRLIEKEVYTPLSVILDRFFVAPHLASGDSKQVADALWEELDEIRAPVTWVSAWLQRRDDASLSKMIHPMTTNDLKGNMPSDDQLRDELIQMSLEDFLDTL